MILGFDCSTTTCGWSFYDHLNSKVTDCGFIDISKQTTNKDKTFEVTSFLDKHPLIKTVHKINLEAALSGFAGGRTSQQVIIKLARFNAIFEYIISEHWNVPVALLSVNTMRKNIFGKCRVKGIKPKDYVKAELSKRMDLSKWDTLTSRGNWDPRNSDVYDAIVCSMN
jgi:hypothetical protein